MHTKHIDIHQHFLRETAEEKDMDINYIRREENPENIMTNNFPKADHVKHTNRITEVELWDLVGIVRGNVNDNGVMDVVTDFD